MYNVLYQIAKFALLKGQALCSLFGQLITSGHFIRNEHSNMIHSFKFQFLFKCFPFAFGFGASHFINGSLSVTSVSLSDQSDRSVNSIGHYGE